MSGIGLLLSTAKDALLAQQLALDVVSHNIANVNTPGYSRQTAELTARQPAPYAGMMLGRGVEVEEVSRNADAFIEKRLQQRKTDLSSLKEQEVYMSALEAIFNESSDRSLATTLTEFWNAWHDLANNPSGASERGIVYEKGQMLCEALNGVHGDLEQLSSQLNLSLQAGVTKVNDLTDKIADLNQQILSGRINGNPNDLLDKRNQLITELSQYMDIRYYENEDGSLTVTTGKGYVLVTGADSYSLSYDDGKIRWESSGAVNTDITSTITGGKMGGWLDMRDVTIPQFKADLNELAKNIIWEVNKIHTQGVGTETFPAGQSITGTYGAPTLSGLDFGDKINYSGAFKLWIGDADGQNLQQVDVDLSGLNGASSISDLATRINNRISAAGLTGVSASVADNKLVISADSNHSFAFSEDTSNILAALGINTFFAGSSPADEDYAKLIRVNPLIDQNKALIAAGKIDPDTGQIAQGDNSNALDMTDLPYAELSMNRHHYSRETASASSEPVTTTLDDYLHALEGSVGIASQGVTRSREYTEVIVNQLEQTRDNISAVSIDEEMTNIIKYQHAYAAAAKLISTGDEMFQTLLDIR